MNTNPVKLARLRLAQRLWIAAATADPTLNTDDNYLQALANITATLVKSDAAIRSKMKLLKTINSDLKALPQ